jgi:hypothetical protein
MLVSKNNSKTILQLNEESFRKAGKYGDQLISILKDKKDDIKNGVMSIRTGMKYLHQDPVMIAFNMYLQKLRMQNIVMIQVILD